MRWHAAAEPIEFLLESYMPLAQLYFANFCGGQLKKRSSASQSNSVMAKQCQNKREATSA